MRYRRPSRPPPPAPRRPPLCPGRASRLLELVHKLLTGGAALATLLRLLF